MKTKITYPISWLELRASLILLFLFCSFMTSHLEFLYIKNNNWNLFIKKSQLKILKQLFIIYFILSLFSAEKKMKEGRIFPSATLFNFQLISSIY